MPLVVVHGITPGPKDALRLFRDELQKTTARVLRIETAHVSCSFPTDMLADNTGTELTIQVYPKRSEQRTEAVRTELAEQLCEASKRFFDEYRLIQCFIHPFEKRDAAILHLQPPEPKTA